MLSKGRILRTLRGERTDRIPIYAPAVTGRMINPLGIPVENSLTCLMQDGVPVQDEWVTRDPNYLEIVKLAKKFCDKVRTYKFPEFDRRFLLVPRQFITVREIKERKGRIMIRYQVKTPKGRLEYVAEKPKNVSTVWHKKPLVENIGDVNKLLSVPYVFQEPDIEDFYKYQKRLDKDGGIMYVWISTPMVCVSQLFSFEKFLTFCLTERRMIDELIQVVFERIYQQLKYLLEQGVGPIFHFGGSEQATPPMMSPQLYDEFVVKYDGQLFDLVHRYKKYVAVHCHGRIKNVLGKMVDMGVDLLDPVEAPPSGDIEIGEAKRKVKGKITLVGNIQFSDLEFSTPETIDKKVRAAIHSGGEKYFILGTTDGPITSVSDKLKKNYIQLIESSIKYGRFS